MLNGTLRIKDWAEHYEINRTRELKYCRWVPVSNDLSNLGSVTLVTHTDGAAHFGVWMALVELASTCVPRGSFVKSGRPMTLESIALVIRMPLTLLEEAVERLRSEQIGWLEFLPAQSDAMTGAAVTDAARVNGPPPVISQQGAGMSQQGATLSQDPAGLSQDAAVRARARTENGMEGNGRAAQGSAASPPNVRQMPARSDTSADVTEEAAAALLPTTPPTNEELNDAARTLIQTLAQHHPAPGEVSKAQEAAYVVLKGAKDLTRRIERIRRSHIAWVAWWKDELQINPHSFVPRLWKWFSDGDWMHPPGEQSIHRQPPSSETQPQRKSARKAAWERA